MVGRSFLWPVLLMALGLGLALAVQTSGGDVAVSDVRFTGANGNSQSALLYRPASATAASPAPGILAVHGYINSRETQSGFAIEFARRGFVVLALDQSGHGYSDPPAFAYGFGGPDALEYLRALEFVDDRRIGLEGHSMGGWAVQMAAAAHPDGYEAMVLEGSSTGTFGAPEGTPTQPRNLLLVFSLFDEFSALMWGAAVPADIRNTDKLKSLFGAEESVVAGQVYGELAEGTARKLLMPAVTHPGDHLSTEAIGAAVDWFELTLGPMDDAPRASQTWYWKELGTLLALIGLAWLVFPLMAWLWRWPYFAALKAPAPLPQPTPSGRWWLFAMTASIIPVLTFFPLQLLGNLILPPNPLLPQQITNGILVWAWGTALINLGLFGVWARQTRPAREMLGLSAAPGALARGAIAGTVVSGAVLAIVAVVQYLLNLDFRFWVVAFKAPSPMQFWLTLVYLPLFAAFFFVLSVTLHVRLRRGDSTARDMLRSGVVLSAGFVVFLVVQYVPLLLGGTLAIASQPLLTIVAFQFVPLLFFVGMVSAWSVEETGSVYTGVTVNAMVVTAYIVAGTATQALPFWW